MFARSGRNDNDKEGMTIIQKRMTIILKEWHRDFWGFIASARSKGSNRLPWLTGGLVRVWKIEWQQTHTGLHDIHIYKYYIDWVWDTRLQMQRLKSVDPAIPFLFYLTKTGLFIFPPFSDPSACYVTIVEFHAD